MAEAIETYKKTSDAAKGSGEVQRAFHTQRDGDALPGEAEMNGASESSGSHTQ
jgi:hypothetical protein